MKVHVALNTPRFDESVRFYRSFLGLEPVKLKPGYAKFDVPEPALNLTLNAAPDNGPGAGAGALNHLGIQVRSTRAVKAAAERLKAEGLATFKEENTDCCYALQDKVWVTDPNGYKWEYSSSKSAILASLLLASPLLASIHLVAPVRAATIERVPRAVRLQRLGEPPHLRGGRPVAGRAVFPRSQEQLRRGSWRAPPPPVGGAGVGG